MSRGEAGLVIRVGRLKGGDLHLLGEHRPQLGLGLLLLTDSQADQGEGRLGRYLVGAGLAFAEGGLFLDHRRGGGNGRDGRDQFRGLLDQNLRTNRFPPIKGIGLKNLAEPWHTVGAVRAFCNAAAASELRLSLAKAAASTLRIAASKAPNTVCETFADRVTTDSNFPSR